MTRKLLLVAATIALIFATPGAGVESADAQTTTRCFVEYYNAVVTCPGAVSATAGSGSGGGAGSAAASTGTAGASTTTTGADAPATTSLAVTGAESQALGYIGAGLLGFGSLAAATARRRTRNLS